MNYDPCDTLEGKPSKERRVYAFFLGALVTVLVAGGVAILLMVME